MKLYVGEETYIISDEARDSLLWQFWNEGLLQYEKLDPALKLAVGLWARKQLFDLEKKSKDKAFRPSRGKDPVIHLAQIIMGALKLGVEDVEIHLEADDNHSISSIGWQQQSKGASR